MKLIAHPYDTQRLGDFLLQGLESDAVAFTGASAFARKSGISYLAPAIFSYSQTSRFQLTVGIDLQGTSKEALELLLASAGAEARLFVFHNPQAAFHPKTFRFEHLDRWDVYAGSGNLTRGGLFENYEAGWVAALEKGDNEDEALNASLSAEFARWSDCASGLVHPLTDAIIKELVDRKLVLNETVIATSRAAARAAAGKAKKTTPLFSSAAVPPAPAVPTAPPAAATPTSGTGGDGSAASATPSGGTGISAPTAGATAGVRTFVITAQQTDVGHGQTTPGTQERAAEYFIPIAVVRDGPAFWGWPALFADDPTWTGPTDSDGRGRMHRRKMPFYVEGAFEWVTMTYNPRKRDFRLGNQRLRNTGSVGDVLRISLAGTSANPVYVAEFVGPASPTYTAELARCTRQVQRPSQKRYGYY